MIAHKVKINDVNRGDLIAGPAGALIADTFSVDQNSRPLWYDTNGGRHLADESGLITVYQVDVSTGHAGQDDKGIDHMVFGERHSVPSPAKAPCDGRLTLDVWEAGTALAGVTCPVCRERYSVVGSYVR